MNQLDPLLINHMSRALKGFEQVLKSKSILDQAINEVKKRAPAVASKLKADVNRMQNKALRKDKDTALQDIEDIKKKWQ